MYPLKNNWTKKWSQTLGALALTMGLAACGSGVYNPYSLNALGTPGTLGVAGCAPLTTGVLSFQATGAAITNYSFAAGNLPTGQPGITLPSAGSVTMYSSGFSYGAFAPGMLGTAGAGLGVGIQYQGQSQFGSISIDVLPSLGTVQTGTLMGSIQFIPQFAQNLAMAAQYSGANGNVLGTLGTLNYASSCVNSIAFQAVQTPPMGIFFGTSLTGGTNGSWLPPLSGGAYSGYGGQMGILNELVLYMYISNIPTPMGPIVFGSNI